MILLLSSRFALEQRISLHLQLEAIATAAYLHAGPKRCCAAQVQAHRPSRSFSLH